jgi:hypothetical protein
LADGRETQLVVIESWQQDAAIVMHALTAEVPTLSPSSQLGGGNGGGNANIGEQSGLTPRGGSSTSKAKKADGSQVFRPPPMSEVEEVLGEGYLLKVRIY